MLNTNVLVINIVIQVKTITTTFLSNISQWKISFQLCGNCKGLGTTNPKKKYKETGANLKHVLVLSNF